MKMDGYKPTHDIQKLERDQIKIKREEMWESMNINRVNIQGNYVERWVNSIPILPESYENWSGVEEEVTMTVTADNKCEEKERVDDNLTLFRSKENQQN